MNGFDIFPFISFLVLISLILERVIFLKQKGVRVSSGSEKKSKSKLFIYPVFVLILFIWLWEIAKSAFQLSVSILPEMLTKFLIESNLMKMTGVLVVGFALVLLALSLLHFKNSLRFGMDEKNRGELITTGVFSFSRNPFFLSIDIYFAGAAFVLPNLFFIGFAVLTFACIHFFILKEEKFMRNVYGNEYENYVQKVKRYF